MSKLTTTILLICTAVLGFVAGKIQAPNTSAKIETSVIKRDIQPEISIIQLKKILGDQLHIKISGPARVLWADENLVENDGEFQIPIGQIPNENDLELKEFAFLANAKTKKFYPSTSYPARGTEARYRRFFQTKEEALAAGFVASKLVK